jgi:hypothetical protein
LLTKAIQSRQVDASIITHIGYLIAIDEIGHHRWPPGVCISMATVDGKAKFDSTMYLGCFNDCIQVFIDPPKRNKA